MCGRYVSARDPMALASLFSVDEVEATTAPDYNVAPTKSVPVILSRTGGAEPVRVLTVAGWGLPSHRRRDQPLFNIRAESVLDRAPFARLLARQRCVIPADGYYEWQRRADGRQPYFLAPADGGVLALAGLYQHQPDGTPVCAMLTTEAVGEHSWLHARSPLCIPTDAWDDWLYSEEPSIALAQLVAVTTLRLHVQPVSRAVNHVGNNGADLIAAESGTIEQAALW